MAIDYLSFVALGGLALTIAAAEPIIELLYGSDYVSGPTVLTILIAAFIPICIGNVAGNMVVAMDLQRRYIWLAVAGLVLNVAAEPAADPRVRDRGGGLDHAADRGRRRRAEPAMVLRRIEMRLSLRRHRRWPRRRRPSAALAVWGLRQAGAGAIVLILAMAALYPTLLIALRALDLGQLKRLVRDSRRGGGVSGPGGQRILVLSNLYPPIAHGGYEVECQGVVDHLRERHEVLVLTSDRDRGEAPAESWVRRELPFLPRRRVTDALSPLYALRGARAARRALEDFSPDLVYVWNGAQLPQAAIRVLETSGAPVAYRVCEHWFGSLYRSRYDPFMRGLTGGRWRRSARAWNRLPALRLDHETPSEVAISWNSEALRGQVEVPPLLRPAFEQVRLPATWQSEELVGLERHPAERATIGFVGRISPEKGVDVALRALAQLRDEGTEAEFEVAGGGEAEHLRELKALADSLGIAAQVSFLGPLDTEALKTFYARIHALVVPSVWEEPAGLVLVEAALAGVPLVASRVGGIPEIVRDPEEALLCPPGDAAALTMALRRTLTDPEETSNRVARASERAQGLRIGPYLKAMDEFTEKVEKLGR